MNRDLKGKLHDGVGKLNIAGTLIGLKVGVEEGVPGVPEAEPGAIASCGDS